MCQAGLSWDWLILDFSYVLVLLGGSLVLRARQAELPTWVMFGALSIAVGGFLFAVTYNMHTSLSLMSSQAMSAGACLSP